MKKTAILICAALTAIASSAEVYNYLTIKQNGKTTSIPLEEVVEVRFTIDDQSTNPKVRILTFEDSHYAGEPNYLGQSSWTSLVDSPQYGGPLLYGDYTGTQYRWCDDGNTYLCSAIDPADEGNVYWNGGEAISHYTNAEYATSDVDYTQQLATPTGGHGGSMNFCVHNGYFDGVFYDSPRGGIWFSDKAARVIDHMYVSLTSYALSVGIRGNRFTPAATSADWVRLVAIGTDASGRQHTTEISMCEAGVFVTGWEKWDLSVLGPVVRLDFNITSSMTGEYGLNFPGYFAYDDIAVVIE